MSREDLKGEIRALRNEVELSTYINKGAIVENKELKSRVSELERENVALRTTERRLTETEEKLEDCEQTIKDQEREILKLENTASDLRNALRQAAREKDRRSDIWKQMRRLMDSEDAASEPLENEAGPSTSVSGCACCDRVRCGQNLWADQTENAQKPTQRPVGPSHRGEATSRGDTIRWTPRASDIV
jgi:DNA repair exonuclease SbcCD ATPase subunit